MYIENCQKNILTKDNDISNINIQKFYVTTTKDGNLFIVHM